MPALPEALEDEFETEVIERQQGEHARECVEQALKGGGHGGLENIPGGPGDAGVEVLQENEGADERRGVLDGVLGGGEIVHAGNGVPHDQAEALDRGIGIGRGLFDEPRERETGLRGVFRELLQLAAGFVEMAAEPLQVLLHELRDLGEDDGTDDAERAVQEAIAGSEQDVAVLHWWTMRRVAVRSKPQPRGRGKATDGLRGFLGAPPDPCGCNNLVTETRFPDPWRRMRFSSATCDPMISTEFHSTRPTTQPFPSAASRGMESGEAIAVVAMILRMGLAVTCLGHGAVGLGQPVLWRPYLAMVGFTDSLATPLGLILAGAEILYGLAVLLRPSRLLFLGLILWMVWTSPVPGEPVWTVISRAANHGVPLALLVLAGWKGSWTGRVLFQQQSLWRQKMMAWVLRLVTACMLVGHAGAVWFAPQSGLVQVTKVLGMGDPVLVLLIAGAFEVLLAGLVLVSPGPVLLFGVCIWKICVEAPGQLSMPSLAAWAAQFASFAAPLALILAGKRARQLPVAESGYSPWPTEWITR